MLDSILVYVTQWLLSFSYAARPVLEEYTEIQAIEMIPNLAACTQVRCSFISTALWLVSPSWEDIFQQKQQFHKDEDSAPLASIQIKFPDPVLIKSRFLSAAVGSFSAALLTLILCFNSHQNAIGSRRQNEKVLSCLFSRSPWPQFPLYDHFFKPETEGGEPPKGTKLHLHPQLSTS